MLIHVIFVKNGHCCIAFVSRWTTSVNGLGKSVCISCLHVIPFPTVCVNGKTVHARNRPNTWRDERQLRTVPFTDSHEADCQLRQALSRCLLLYSKHRKSMNPEWKPGTLISSLIMNEIIPRGTCSCYIACPNRWREGVTTQQEL